MAKRKPLTPTRREAVDNFMNALGAMGIRFENFDIDAFVEDYKNGAALDADQYKVPSVLKSKPKVKKPKAPLWKRLLGISD